MFNLEECTLSSNGSNDYFFLQPGYQLTLEGEEDREAVQLIVTVMNETKTVDGIETRIVEERESVDGELVEISKNYFAICKETDDIFYFGEDVDDYEDGEIVSHEGGWLAGLDGARAGLIIPANPKIGMKYYQEIAPGVAEDRAEITSLNEVVDTPAGKFDNVVKVEETNPLEGNEKEYKFYAHGIGLIQDADLKLVSYVLPKAMEEDGSETKTDKERLQMEKRKAIIARESGDEIHQRHIQANPSSTGNYSPGLEYRFEAAGTGISNGTREVTMAMDISVWKSNGAVVIMDVIGGTITVGEEEYDIALGYALYSVRHSGFRSAALAVAENGDVLVLKLYGSSMADVQLAATAGGAPLGLTFGDEAQHKRSSLDSWTLVLEGTLKS